MAVSLSGPPIEGCSLFDRNHLLTFRPESPAHFSTVTDQGHQVVGFVSVPITAYRGLQASFVEP
jgi:hypothetical protein